MVTRSFAFVSGLLVVAVVLAGAYLAYSFDQVPARIAEASKTMRMTDSMRLTLKVALLSQRGSETYLLAVQTHDKKLLDDAKNLTKASIGFVFSDYIDKDDLVERAVPLLRQNLSLMQTGGLDPTPDVLDTLKTNTREIYRIAEQIEKDIWVNFQTEFVEFQNNETRLRIQYQFMIIAAVVVSLVLLAVFVRQRSLNRELRTIDAGLRESEHLLREAQSLARLGNWDLDLRTGQARWSDEEFRLLGYQPGQVNPSAEAFMAAVHPDDRADVAEEMERSMDPEQEAPYSIVHRVRTASGDRFLQQHGQVEFSADKQPLRMVGTTADITELRSSQLELERYRDQLEELVEERTRDLEKEISDRRRIQEDLHRSETRLRQILDSSSAGISILRMHPIRRIYANQRFLEFFHAESFEQLDEFGFENTFVEPGDLETAGACVERGEGFQRFVMERRRVDNTTWWGLHDAIPIEFEDAPATIVWHYDITDQKLAEKELVQTEKLASLGGLVAGLAHEVNTPIGVGLTAATFMEEKVADVTGEVEKESLTRRGLEEFLDLAGQSSRIIVANLHRASELVSSFKQVAVDQSSDELRTFKLVDYIDEILLSLLPQTKKTPHTITVTGDRDVVLTSFPGALSQIITNLVMNSLNHAFDEGEAGEIRIDASRSGQNAHIHYSDSGRGVSPEVLNRIFDPFFTTKRGSGGSGLGMHIVYNLATKKLGGGVVCESTPGQGISVHLTVPLSQPKPQDGS
ncbi:ATP-binding protein [Roseibium sediminicola]|uniref:histidine kinase n=1 Tax=Roseibium sediminicola TaxID=2933272 RepID=A0ABT0GMV2_9HYPH|nr:ATP-binding protein [Roseibium sp. CAU 1639]MCK7610575.1 ATP-binding protein [Roseibium sp. CAU 1639]